MKTYDGGEVIVRMLKQENVEYIFGLCGGHINPIFNSCADHGIKIIDTRHEQAAAMMADAYSRITRKPGVFAVTAGPGHTNSVGGLASAYITGSPVISISGNSQAIHFEKGALQEIDQVGIVKPITKWARLVTDHTRLDEYIATAFRVALTGEKGPVHISIPVDTIMKRHSEEIVTNLASPESYRSESKSLGDPELISKAIELLKGAKKPVIIVGNDSFWSFAEQDLVSFIDKTQIPVFTSDLARGLISDNHPCCFGEASPPLNGSAKLIGEADVIMILGLKLNYRVNYGRPPLFHEDATLIKVDLSAASIGVNRGIDVGIVGDIKKVLGQFNEMTSGDQWVKNSSWLKELQEAKDKRMAEFEPYRNSEELPIHPLRMVKELESFIDEDTIVVYDGGDIKYWARTRIKALRPAQWLDIGPYGTLGIGIPSAIAAKLAYPKAKVLNIIGDGSFGLSCAEFDTALRHNLPFVSVIGNDGAWGMIAHNQREIYGEKRIVGCRLGVRRYDKWVEGMGGYGEYVERPEDIKPAIERAISSGLPACVNVAIKCEPSPVTESTMTYQMWKREMELAGEKI